jgi:hypothetical protein
MTRGADYDVWRLALCAGLQTFIQDASDFYIF